MACASAQALFLRAPGRGLRRGRGCSATPGILKNKTTCVQKYGFGFTFGAGLWYIIKWLFVETPRIFGGRAHSYRPCPGVWMGAPCRRRKGCGPPPGRASTAGRRIWDRRRPLLYEDEFELTFDLSGLQPDTPDPQPEPVPEPEAEPAPGRSRRRPRQKIPTQKCSGLRRTGRAC